MFWNWVQNAMEIKKAHDFQSCTHQTSSIGKILKIIESSKIPPNFVAFDLLTILAKGTSRKTFIILALPVS
jgi:hypothetical protein